MSTTATYSYPVTQVDYDAGVRVYVCEFCPNGIKASGAVAETLECTGCVPNELGELKSMELATYNATTQAFEWTKSTGLVL